MIYILELSSTRSSMSGLRITIRAPPNREFVHGYPGLPASTNGGTRPAAHVSGVVELRPKSSGIKALVVRVELKKCEQIQGTRGTSRYRELIGVEPVVLWKSSKPRGGLEDPGYDLLLSVRHASRRA